MVSASLKSKVRSSLPTTRCTNCQTVFELPPELLESSDTRVRCGECLCIFDARDGLVETDESSGNADGAGPASAPKRGKNKSKKSARGKKAKRKKAKKDKHADVASTESDENSELDVTYSDFDLFSEDADLPALAYLDETRDTPEFDFDSVELGDEETFSDTLFTHDITIDADLPMSETKLADGTLSSETLGRYSRTPVEFTEDTEPEEPLIFKYKDPAPAASGEGAAEAQPSDDGAGAGTDITDNEQVDSGNKTASNVLLNDSDVNEVPVNPGHGLEGKQKRRSNLLIWCSGMALLMVVFAVTLIYPRWKTLDQSPTFRPMKLAVCEWLACTVDTRVSIDQLEVLKREVFESPSRDGALLITIAIRNNADFPQRYPVVEARMTNRVGRSVAQRAFRPADYLPQWGRGDVLRAGETVDINLTVNDPGEAAEHHVLQLRELQLDCNPVKTPDGGERWPANCAEL